MHPEEGPVANAAEQLQHHFGEAPPTAIVLGSGLGPLVDRLDKPQHVPFEALGLPESGVSGHAGKAVLGSLGGGAVVAMSGRIHLYEGHSVQAVVRAVRALHRWGVERLLLTASTGSLRLDLTPGSLVSVTDHINFQCDNPLRGPLFGGSRFPDPTHMYDPDLRATLRSAAADSGHQLHAGVLAAMNGPAYETPAESGMLRVLGADLAGMSTVPEALAALALGFPCAAIAVVSNYTAGTTDVPVTHEGVTDIARVAAQQLTDILELAVGRF